MAREKEFDVDHVLDRAADAFWRLGYDATSIQDLEDATGLGRGSLYNAFGDKEGLFLAALDRYSAKYGTLPLHHLEDPNVSCGIRSMLEGILARMKNPKNPQGCMLTNACLQGPGSPGIAHKVAASMKYMEDRLERAITRAKDTGQIEADAEPRQLARFYSAVAQSLGVTHKALGDARRLKDIIDVAMRAWPERRGAADD
jgi:TetR/AcrR family transcriptional regulator, transcriptional repressor for nem operon